MIDNRQPVWTITWVRNGVILSNGNKTYVLECREGESVDSLWSRTLKVLKYFRDSISSYTTFTDVWKEDGPDKSGVQDQQKRDISPITLREYY